MILEGTERFSVQQEGLSRLPPKKGMFAKENFLERVKVVDRKMGLEKTAVLQRVDI